LRRWIAITLGIVSSIGGFFDMGEIVMTAETGARFGLSLVWVVIVGVTGIIIYAEMAGRIATLTRRPVFDAVRERLGANIGFLNLIGTLFVNILTLVAEVAGIALAFELVTSINYLLWAPLGVVVVWLIIWRVRFESMERTIGIIGLAMLVFGVAFWKLGPDWGRVAAEVFTPSPPPDEALPTYWYFAVALFGASMTPYEVIFYSSGAVEENWTKEDLSVNKGTAYIGFAVGGLFAASAIGVAAMVLAPRGVTVEHLSTVALGPAAVLGTAGLVAFIIGLFASTFGAALEVTLSNGYAISQFFGWRWGTRVRPKEDARFHLAMIICLIVALILVLTSLDPIRVTELSVVFSAVALPLTYLPVLIVANDRDYMGDRVNGPVLNVIGSIYLVLVLAASIAAVPLLIWTKMGS
jgi:manganese transport protein